MNTEEKELLLKEQWKDVPGFEGLYQVSNMGNVYFLPKTWVGNNGYLYHHSGKMIAISNGPRGYKIAKLQDSNGKRHTKRVHQLVAMAFLNHVPCGLEKVVDHIDGIKHDNHLKNLQVISNRANIHKSLKPSKSKYIGVFEHRPGRWMAYIHVNGKREHLGYYTSEEDANNAYQKRLKEVENIVPAHLFVPVTETFNPYK